MNTEPFTKTLAAILDELANGMVVRKGGGPFVLNTGDVGLLRSLDNLSAADASRSANDGATIAAHAQHVRYGLELMNRWATEGGNPFADAKWDEAWKISSVDEPTWREIRNGLRAEVERWAKAIASPRNVTDVELGGMVGSLAHFAYHLGAIRQIHKATRGPREGTFP